MKILLAAATELELLPIRNKINCSHQVVDLITGIGSMATCFSLFKSIQTESPDWVIQAGIAGCFTNNYPPGTILGVKSEFLGDLGVEENNEFSDVFDLGFALPNQTPFFQKSLPNTHWSKFNQPLFPLVNGLTVNEVTTRPERINLLLKRYKTELETMEGAALHYTCLLLNQPFLQIRAISNFVGERDKKKWEIGKALSNLAIATNDLLNLI